MSRCGERQLCSLSRRLRGPANQLLAIAHANDPALVVTSARRTRAQQAALYRNFLAGRSHGIPALPPGRSMHELGRAFDLARPGVDPFKDPLLAALGGVWNSWGGLWHPSDPVHFEA